MCAQTGKTSCGYRAAWQLIAYFAQCVLRQAVVDVDQAR
jgi:hypothetical protein